MARAGKREELETWLVDNNIDIAVIQETRAGTDTREVRKHTHGTIAEAKEY